MIVGAHDQKRADCVGQLPDSVVLPVPAVSDASARLDDTASPACHIAQKGAVTACFPAGEAESATEESSCASDQTLAQPELKLQTSVSNPQGHGRDRAPD